MLNKVALETLHWKCVKCATLGVLKTRNIELIECERYSEFPQSYEYFQTLATIYKFTDCSLVMHACVTKYKTDAKFLLDFAEIFFKPTDKFKHLSETIKW